MGNQNTGLFGALWGFISLFSMGKDSIKGSKINRERKEQAIRDYYNGRNDSRTYIDNKGSLRDIDTDQKVIFDNDYSTGDLWISDVHLNRMRNVTAEKRERKKIEAKHNNDSLHTTIELGKKDEVSYFDPALKTIVRELLPKGYWYQDINTGEKYVERSIGWNSIKKDLLLSKMEDRLNIDLKEKLPERFHGYFYMNVETGLLVRISDRALQYDFKQKDKHERLGNFYTPLNMEVYECFIELFNEYQKIMRSKYCWQKRFLGNVSAEYYESQSEFDKYFLNYSNYTM